MKQLRKQESFSFSTSSKIDLFSDDEDGGVDDHNHNKRRIPNPQQNDYFEISLPPPSPLIDKTKHDYAKGEEFEFCFSFNSSSNPSNFPTSPITISNHHEQPITTSTQMVNVVDKRYNHLNKTKNSINYKSIFQKATSPRCHQGLISPYVFRAPIEGQRVTMLHTFEKNQRNSSRLVGIRKFMVKLRSIKRILHSSLNVSRRLKPTPIDKVDKKTKKTFIDHKLIRDYSKKATKNNDNNNIVVNFHGQNQTREEEKASKKMNFSGFSKMFNVIVKNIRITRRSKQTGSKSCPVSIKSSPMHDHDIGNGRDERRNSFYSRDHSIQAAIAHCKKSFGK